MSETTLEDLADRIRPYVRQCPFETVTQALVDIMRDFYNWTRAYQVESNDTIQALVADYDIDLPSVNVEPITLEDMTVNRFPCYPKTAAWLSEYVDRNWRNRSANDFRYYTMLTPGSFAFPCVPTAMGTPGGIYYRASYRPTLGAVAIEAAQAAEWLDAWSAGALWRLKEMGGEPKPAWQDLLGAKEKKAEYLHARGHARIRVGKSYVNSQDRFVNRRGFAR